MLPDNVGGDDWAKTAPKKEDPHRTGPLGAMKRGGNRYRISGGRIEDHRGGRKWEKNPFWEGELSISMG